MAPVELGRLPAVLLFLAERLADHVAADEREQRENDPMINRGDVFAERVGREKAQKREQCLEAAEPQCGLDDVDRPHARDGQPLSDRDGESVHGDGYGNKQYLNHSWNIKVHPAGFPGGWASTDKPPTPRGHGL